MSSFIVGFTTSLSLILAIGSQNAFVLKQGIKKQHVFLVCIICAVSDSILISLGVSGFSVVIKEFPEIEQIAKYGGALFLLVYAFLSFKSAFKSRHALTEDAQIYPSVLKTALVCLAFTWLNPHVYLDTMILLGSISTQYPETKLEFVIGAVSSSFVFFFSLGYGAQFLAPLFKKPKAWQVLEFIVGVMMLAIAVLLLFG